MANEVTSPQSIDFRGLQLFCEQTLYYDGPSDYVSFLFENEAWSPLNVHPSDEPTWVLQQFAMILLNDFSSLQQRMQDYASLLSAYAWGTGTPSNSQLGQAIGVGVSLHHSDWYHIEQEKIEREQHEQSLRYLGRRQIEGMLLYHQRNIIEDPVFGDANPDFGRQLYSTFCARNPYFVTPLDGLLRLDGATILFSAIDRASNELTLEGRISAYRAILDTYTDDNASRYASSHGFSILLEVVHHLYDDAISERLDATLPVDDPQPDPFIPMHNQLLARPHALQEGEDVYISLRDSDMPCDSFVAYIYDFIDPQSRHLFIPEEATMFTLV